MTDHSFARAWQTVAALAPERTALVCGDRRLTFGEFDDRAERLAHVLRDAGVEPDDKVAIMCVNAPEYLEAFFARAEARLRPGERQLPLRRRRARVPARQLRRGRARVPRRLRRDRRRRARPRSRADRRPRVLLQVAHTGDIDLLAGARDYEDTLAAVDAQRARDDARARRATTSIFLYTGGTTGYPKAVMWRSDDLYVSLWQMARPGTEPPDVATSINAGKQAATLLPACPLMHGTGLFIALSTLVGRRNRRAARHAAPRSRGGVERRSSASTCRCARSSATRSPARCSARSKPSRTRWDLSALRAITSSGVTWSPETKRGLLALLPNVTLIDSLGASEGIMTRTETRASDDIAPARFKAGERLVVVTDDGDVVRPGDERVGMLGVGGPIPLGYYKDPEKTAATFRTVEGRRYSIPGDYATVDPDGTIRLLGRGSACINTGGEKVYPEEVELALRSHPDVFDCVVVGVPDDRWGEMVVALVQPADAATSTRPSSPRTAGRRSRATRCRSASSASTRSSVRPRARPTTSCCAHVAEEAIS